MRGPGVRTGRSFRTTSRIHAAPSLGIGSARTIVRRSRTVVGRSRTIARRSRTVVGRSRTIVRRARRSRTVARRAVSGRSRRSRTVASCSMAGRSRMCVWRAMTARRRVR